MIDKDAAQRNLVAADRAPALDAVQHVEFTHPGRPTGDLCTYSSIIAVAIAAEARGRAA
jgi:hypothetical protein